LAGFLFLEIVFLEAGRHNLKTDFLQLGFGISMLKEYTMEAAGGQGDFSVICIVFSRKLL
jgi:hypothetical protein